MQKINDFIKFNCLEDAVWLTGALLLVCSIMLPMPLMGISDGNDFAQHIQFAQTYYNSIGGGDFFPGWAAADNYGFGSVGIRFYPPLAYYSFAFTRMLAGNWFDATWLNFLFWMLCGSVGVYLWAKQWLDAPNSAFAAVLYALAPYHLSQIYQTLLYAEFAAAGVLPFCFLFLTKLCRRGKTIDVLLFSAAFSLLILTHIPTAIIGSLTLAVYGLLLADWKQIYKTVFNFALSAILSLAATAFYWMKLVTEVEWVKHNSEQYSTDHYDYRQYFFPMLRNWDDSYQRKLLWHFDSSFVLAFLLLLPLLFLLLKKYKSLAGDERKFVCALAGSGLFTFFMAAVPSWFLWSSVSVLQKLQFPWRWLSAASLVSTVAFVFAVSRLTDYFKNQKKLIIYASLVLMTAIMFFDITQNILISVQMPRGKFENKIAAIEKEPGNQCWWSVWAEIDAFKERERVAAALRTVTISEWNSEHREFVIEAGAPAQARVATFYYPYWRAEINGEIAAVEKAADGSILIPVAAEHSAVKLYFQEPLKVRFAFYLSIVVWLALVSAIAGFYAFGKRRVSRLK